MSFVPSKIKNTDSLADFKNLTLRNGDLVFLYGNIDEQLIVKLTNAHFCIFLAPIALLHFFFFFFALCVKLMQNAKKYLL